jgi:hypothetical protein
MTDSQNASATGIQLIANQSLQFASPVAGIQMAVLPIAGAAWIDTDDGVVVIDTLIGERAARQMFERINGQIKYIIYTHGHLDHVGGTAALMRDSPVVVASDYCRIVWTATKGSHDTGRGSVPSSLICRRTRSGLQEVCSGLSIPPKPSSAPGQSLLVTRHLSCVLQEQRPTMFAGSGFRN